MSEVATNTAAADSLEAEVAAALKANEPDLFPARLWQGLTGEALHQAADIPAPRAEVLRDMNDLGLLYRGEVNLIAGEAGTGKTWLALEACRQVALNGERVLWIDLENSARTFAQRLTTLGLPRNAFDRIEYLDPAGVFDLETFDEYLTQQWGLVVVDSMTAALGVFTNDGDSNSGDSIQRLYTKRLRPLTKTGAAVLVIDHKPKAAAGTRSRGGIGSERKLSALQGAAYTVEALQVPAPGALGELLITLDKDNAGAIRERLAADRERRSLTQEAAYIEIDSRGVAAGNYAPTVIRVHPARPVADRKAERLEEASTVLSQWLEKDTSGVLTGRTRILDQLKSLGVGIRTSDLVPLLESGVESRLWVFERVGSRPTFTLRRIGS